MQQLSSAVIYWIESSLKCHKQNGTSYPDVRLLTEGDKPGLASNGFSYLRLYELRLLALKFLSKSIRDYINLKGQPPPQFKRIKNEPAQNCTKAVFVAYMNSAFYVNEKCERLVPKDDFIWEAISTKYSSSNTLSSPAATAAASSSMISSTTHNQTVQRPTVLNPYPLTQNFNGNSVATAVSSDHSTSTSSSAGYPQSSVQTTTTSNTSELIDLVASPNGISPHVMHQMHQRNRCGRYTSKLAQVSADKVKVKIEKDVMGFQSNVPGSGSSTTDYYDTNPRTPYERIMLNQLRGMGFTDTREMLNGIRHFSNDDTNSFDHMNPATMEQQEGRVDEIMFYIVTQREEAEEAKKMDQVRMASEVIVIEEEVIDVNSPQHISQTMTREEILGPKQGVLASTAKSSCFPSSIILESPKLKNIFYASLVGDYDKSTLLEVVQLLTLEQKAQKWFGSIIPDAFFRHVLQQKFHTEESCINLKEFLRKEIQSLENSLYTLSEQEKGDLGMMVPKIFLRARETYGKQDVTKDEIILLDDD